MNLCRGKYKGAIYVWELKSCSEPLMIFNKLLFICCFFFFGELTIFLFRSMSHEIKVFSCNLSATNGAGAKLNF